MFQSFPLGDKSSVNLRGEYHVENVTTFDLPTQKESDADKMDEDTDTDSKSGLKPALSEGNGVSKVGEERGASSKLVTFSSPDVPKDFDKLYPIFWSLQDSFSQPKKLFDKQQFASFKSGLEATMTVFMSVQNENNGRPARSADESKRGTKRKRGQSDEDLANGFNPKYLTSRDLFELEVSKLSIMG